MTDSSSPDRGSALIVEDEFLIALEVPSIFVTAHSDDGTLERIRQAVPGSPILSKPIYRERLAAAIAEIVH
jgi:CheY-like chemotaxis protein